MYNILFYGIKGSLGDPRKCAGKQSAQMHKFVAGFNYLSVQMCSYLCNYVQISRFFIDRNANDVGRDGPVG